VSLLSKLGSLFSGGKKEKSSLPVIDVNKRFELIGRTGQGSMSKVWRARDKMTGRTVCLKVLDKVKTLKFEQRFPGLKRPTEGAVLTALKHKNVVATYEHGLTKEGEQYLVMELVDGMGLNFLIETKSAQMEGNRNAILEQMADGLEFVHKKGFIHRDICPRNVMVTKELEVKLIDFGLTIPNKPEFCKPGNRTGTPDFLAPEVIKRVTTDQRVDLFALGVTAYVMYTDNLPWEKAESYQVLLNHMNTAGRDPRDHVPNLDKRVAQFLIKSIARDAGERYQTAGEFKAALQRLPEA
jgi:serine/threonine protein kinase